MGTQQLLLIIVGVIVVGLAIAGGIWLFGGNSVSANKDAIISDMMNLGQTAVQYKMRPAPLGGGGGKSYVGFTIPSKLANNDNATYTCVAIQKQITFTAVSAVGYGNIIAVLDSTGTINISAYTGDF